MGYSRWDGKRIRYNLATNQQQQNGYTQVVAKVVVL